MKVITIILGVLMVIAGIFCLLNPALTYLSLGYILALGMVMDAIGGIFTWSERRKKGLADGWTLAGSIISLVFGLVLLGSAFMQVMVDAMIVYLVAFWLLVVGIIRIVGAIQLHRLHKEYEQNLLGQQWWIPLLSGILLVACGILSFSNPVGLILALGINFGINMIVAGASLITIAG